MQDAPSAASEPRSSRRPIVELLMLAGPTVAQMASYTVMQFIDTWMLAHVGRGIIAPTAASNAGMLAFSVISLGMGVQWVVNTLVSQSYGRKDDAECGRYLWQGVWFGLLFSVLLLPVLPFAGYPFHAAGHEANLVRSETLYLQIVLGASVLKLVGTAFSQFLLAVDRPRFVLYSTLIGVSINALAAWTLIFGHFGFHSMDVAGSAWGQNIGVLFETTALICFALMPTIRRRFNVRDWRLRKHLFLTLLKVGVPSGVQVEAEVLAWSIFSIVVMGGFGTAAMAANTFTFRFMSVSFMPAFGISMAVTALVGRYLGMGREDLARSRADLGFVLTAAVMFGWGIGFFVGRHQLMGMFTADVHVLRIGGELLIFAAVYQLFDAMYIVYNGALRGAGDTFVPAIVTGGLCWGITVLGGYAVARFEPSWGPVGPWSCALFYGVILGFFMLIRFRSRHWKAIEAEATDGTQTSIPLQFAVDPSSNR